MTCRECAEFLADYLSGEVPPDVRATFERHLTRCPNCVTYVEQYRATIEAGKAAFEHETPEDFPEELVRAILAARKS
ncbi:MAG: anti-sigma factor family protein [Vicinamibacterales bacterium]